VGEVNPTDLSEEQFKDKSKISVKVTNGETGRYCLTGLIASLANTYAKFLFANQKSLCEAGRLNSIALLGCKQVQAFLSLKLLNFLRARAIKRS
jgi:hypothetical protein